MAIFWPIFGQKWPKMGHLWDKRRRVRLVALGARGPRGSRRQNVVHEDSLRSSLVIGGKVASRGIRDHP